MNKSKKRIITIEDLARIVLPADPRVSPDGSRVLFTRKHAGEQNATVSNLWIVPTDGSALARPFTSGGKDGNGRWSPDGSRIAFVSDREKGHPQVFVISTEGGEALPLTEFPEGTIGGLAWSPDGRWLAVRFRGVEPDRTKASREHREEHGLTTPPRVIDDIFYRLDGDGYFGGQRYGLYLVDAETGEHRLIFDRDRCGFFEFDWSPDSKELVVSANTHERAIEEVWRSELYRVTLRGRVKKIAGLPPGEKAAPKWSPTGEWIAYAQWEGRETWGARNGHVCVVRPDGSERRDLTANEDYCPGAATLSDTAEVSFGATFVWRPGGETLLVQIGANGEQHVAEIAIDGQSRYRFLTRGRRVFALGNVTADGVVALLDADPTRPADVAVGKLGAVGKPLKTKRLTSLNADLIAELELSEPEPHWVESTDGVRVHTWVLRPPASVKVPKRAPCIVEVHGGPHTQYGETFFHEFQLLAAAGYVVVYSNPRGSKGYGEEHTLAIRGRWGVKDWDDVRAVTDFAASLPDVDPKRIGIMGGSYGGYMTNWAIGHTDRYRAAITDRCVSNFLSMAGSSDFPLIPGGEYWDASPWEKSEVLWEQSPIAHFANVSTPTLVIHSEGDLRCNVEQGEQVFVALKRLGIPTRFVRYPHETSHGLSRGGPMDLRQHRLREILRWWSEWL